jgi:hypothetical protein
MKTTAFILISFAFFICFGGEASAAGSAANQPDEI